MKVVRAAWAAALMVAAALSLAGCSGAPEGAVPSLSGSPAAALSVEAVEKEPLAEDGVVPVFTGPYAGLFDAAYRRSLSDLQRSVLEDGDISDEEMTALRDAFTQCAMSRGLAKVEFFPDGSMSTTYGEGMDGDTELAIVRECDGPTLGELEVIYNSMQRNPANDDPAALTAECLVEAGIAQEGYSGDDFARDSMAQSFPFDSDSLGFRQCATDPLGLMGR